MGEVGPSILDCSSMQLTLRNDLFHVRTPKENSILDFFFNLSNICHKHSVYPEQFLTFF